MAATQTAASPLRLGTPVQDLPGVGDRRAQLYTRLGIHTVSDLIRHLPTRYEQQWDECPIDDLPMNQVGTTRAMIVATRVVSGRHHRGVKPRFEATLEDHSGRLTAVWFNGLYLQEKLHPGLSVRIQGKTIAYRGQPKIVNPKWEALQDPDKTPTRAGRLRPVYPATEELSTHTIERLIKQTLPRVLGLVTDPVPPCLLEPHGMPPLPDAFKMAHQPADMAQATAARQRLAYNELLLLQLGIAAKRSYNQTRLEAPPLRWSPAIDQHIRQRFPFQLTDAQEKVVREITGDLRRDHPMNRLLQGDVGSGKTVVALYALLLAVANRKQGALMAPTELLAEQHFQSISAMLKGSNVKLALLTGGQGTSRGTHRAAMVKRIEHGQVDIVIGTQALLTESVMFKDLAVAVIDEQHRFGVLQRAAFRSRPTPGTPGSGGEAGKVSSRPSGPLDRQPSPHYLVMTATPIPRSLSLTLFGDLDVSTITGLPPGRTPITTRLVKPDQADRVYTHLAQRVARGEQAYVVVPAIDGDETASLLDQDKPTATRGNAANQLKSVRAHARWLADKYLPDHRVSAIHGKLKPQTRDSIMQKFRAGQTHVLVATTVIEVGVDVPNATMMVVEHAERFGLAQLHQLRGRIGRGTEGQRSVCVFIADATTEDATQRLEAIANTADGFKIAERDLAIRGMGDFFGTRQHGMPPLRVARIPDDMKLLKRTRDDAQGVIDDDPTLSKPGHTLLRKLLIQQYGDALGLIDVG